ncbi:MAG: hypothetical protein KC457_32225, partial [Myxococcales bacterium]|nr:hypothetical protein [Myxococcales bacterium]
MLLVGASCAACVVVPNPNGSGDRGDDVGDGTAGIDTADTADTGDALDRWPLTLELVDVDDRGRWCTLADVATGSDAATALAREPRFADLLPHHLRQAADAVVAAVPEVAPWLANRATHTDIDGAAAV